MGGEADSAEMVKKSESGGVKNTEYDKRPTLCGRGVLGKLTFADLLGSTSLQGPLVFKGPPVIGFTIGPFPPWALGLFWISATPEAGWQGWPGSNMHPCE